MMTKRNGTRCNKISLGILFSLLLNLFIINTAAAVIVDVMIVYDTTATTWVASNGGMAAFSQDAVSRMNQALQNSGLDDDSFRLVHSMSVNYTTTSNGTTGLSPDLYPLQSGSGVFEPVHTARDYYGADLVAMMVDTGSAYGYVGVGYTLWQWSGTPDYGFTVNAIRSVEFSHTMTHEVGHNLGAHHAKNQASSPGPNNNLDGQYSAGWYFTGTNGVKYHTIMAYNSDGFGGYYQSAPLFSTPLITHQQTPAGDANDGDNRRLISETIGTIADYKYSSNVTLTGLSISGPTTVNENSTATYTATASWSDGSTSSVNATWSENSPYTSINSSGVLSVSSIPSDQTVTISASFTSGGITRSDTPSVLLKIGSAVPNLNPILQLLLFD